MEGHTVKSSYRQLKIIAPQTAGGPIQLCGRFVGERMRFNFGFMRSYSVDTEDRDMVVA